MNYLPYTLVGFGLMFIWASIDTILLMREAGPCKRGLPIWREALPPHIEMTLRAIPAGYKDWRGFIKTDGAEVLVRARAWLRRSLLPCVGYIDLRRANPMLEYRTSFPSLLLAGLVTLVFSIFIFPIPVFMAVLLYDYMQQRKLVRDYLEHVYQQVLRPLPTDEEIRRFRLKLVLLAIGVFVLIVLLVATMVVRSMRAG